MITRLKKGFIILLYEFEEISFNVMGMNTEIEFKLILLSYKSK